MDFSLLQELCAVPAPSGSEYMLTAWLNDYLQKNMHSWKQTPKVHQFQDCLIWVFGKPRTAVFTHLDSVGFSVGYNNELLSIGAPNYDNGVVLIGKDSQGYIETIIEVHEDEYIFANFDRIIERGTKLTFKPIWSETEDTIQCCYMDNRGGLWVTLKLCETLQNGIIVFSCYEEHGGGTVGFLADFIQKQYNIQQALICDITWCTDGVEAGKGVAISLRDRLIPRQIYLDKIVALAQKSGISFQLEVESAGGSDGSEIQRSPLLMDWCFIGAPEDNVHCYNEILNKQDLIGMLKLYEFLMNEL
jgi:putative aminopeptidase FrvX